MAIDQAGRIFVLKINKHGVPNKAMWVGKKSKKRIKKLTRLLGTSEYT